MSISLLKRGERLGRLEAWNTLHLTKLSLYSIALWWFLIPPVRLVCVLVCVCLSYVIEMDDGRGTCQVFSGFEKRNIVL